MSHTSVPHTSVPHANVPGASISYARLDELNRTLQAYSHAIAMLGVDEATIMPEGGGRERASAISTLAAIAHEKSTAPHIADWISRACDSDPDPDQAAGLREFRRIYEQNTCLDARFIREKTRATINCEQSWRKLRPDGDWKAFAPALKEVVSLVRQEARIRSRASGLAPYDALIEQYDPGTRMARIDPVFSTLKDFLTDFLPHALRRQEIRLQKNRPRPLDGTFPMERQRALAKEMMKRLGFDFSHGRLDTSHHPFCGGVPSDVRITTRYDTKSFLPALMGVLHETGHALYEQGLPRKNSHWPHNRARGMAMHESQSLFCEMQMARSPMFWKWALPIVADHLGPKAFEGIGTDDILAHVNRVRPGLVRVDADEVTYPLHVILRYEIERDLVSGRLEVDDIPGVWHEKMLRYLGIATENNMKDGPMQDVHWPAGLFGYFPSYTLGALMAAQQWQAMTRDVPDAPRHMENGNFSPMNEWRRKNIWQYGSTLSTEELMERSCGKGLDPKPFMDHLQARYG